MPPFQLVSDFKPTGDQPRAIEQLVEGVQQGQRLQTLLGATGTGKSIAHDDPVFVIASHPNTDLARVIPIGELIDDALRANPQAIVWDGDTEILDVQAGDVRYFTQAFDPVTGEVALHPIASFIRHATPERMFALTTHCGRSATLTGDHNLWVLRRGRLHLIRTDDAQPDDYLPVPLSLLGEGTQSEVDLLGYLGGTGLYVDTQSSFNVYREEKGRLSAITALEGLGFSDAHSKYHSIARRGAGRGLSIEATNMLLEKTGKLSGHWNPSNARIGGSFGANSLPASIPLSSHLLRLIGYYIAEGNYQKGYLILSNHDTKIREDIEEALMRMDMRFSTRPSSDYQISSTALAETLRAWCGSKSRNKRLPDFWPSLSNPALAQILRAYFDGDGTVDRANAVSATTASKRLASDLAYALLRFGIWARISRRFKRATNSAHAGDWYYQVTISGQADLTAFSRHIGFGLTRKQTLLDQKLTVEGNTNVDVIPMDGAVLRRMRQALGVSAEALAQRASLSRAIVQLYELNQRAPSRNAFNRLLAALSSLYTEHGQEDPSWEHDWQALTALAHLRWTRIKTVEPAEYQHPHVYDFCVPGVENFLAGDGGMFVHNTYVVSHLVQQLQRPTLVLAHNKTLAAQLYAEFKEFFPHNAVEYYVSYYDYYQPESYVPRFDLYIEKQTQINDHIERLRVASKAALLSRRDVLIVASVSCIYGTGDPDTWGKYILELRVGDTFKRENILRRLVQLQYARNDMDLAPGAFRVRGDTLEIFPFYEEAAYRILMFDDDIERVLRFDPITGEVLADQPVVVVFPAAQFVADRDKLMKAIRDIEDELEQQVKFFKSQDKLLEAQRIEQRTRYDLEMLREVGFTSGIENYSRPLEQRPPGSPPHSLIDYFPDDYLLVIDESHMTLPQIRGMYNGDQARKSTLVDYGFRLPPQEHLGRLRLPLAVGHGQPPAPFRRVRGAHGHDDFRQRHARAL
ncbi:MAG: hypothetical protein MUC99_07975 [Anaerolineae bacterium]|nr:hypothetical protein [Anaerolineae bacterium]